MGNICLKHNVLILSDEIHCDFTYPGYTHTVFASLNESFADHSIICTAPSKTFNLAGLQVSNILIKNESIRQKLKREMNASGYSQLNSLGLIACKAAYEKGDAWLQELKAYLYDNLQFVREYVKQNLPGIHLVEPQGTYLVWLDCRDLGLSRKEMEQLIVHKAKLWLDAGHIFGATGEGFERVNIACPRSVLKQALDQLSQALKNE
jgi:cystathionine beta-lyase